MEGGSYLEVDPDAESDSDNSGDDSDDGSAPPTDRVDVPPKPKTLNPTYVPQTATPEQVARGRANSGMPTDELEPRMRERVNTGLGGDEVLARLNGRKLLDAGFDDGQATPMPPSSKRERGIVKSIKGSVTKIFRKTASNDGNTGGGGDEDTERMTPISATWSDDWNALSCLECGKRFKKPILKKHNCYACGRAVCSSCSSKRLIRYPHFRVCTLCYTSNMYSAKVKISFRPTPNAVTMATLCKRGHLNKGWKQRLFLLDSNGSLTYFRKNKEAGVIPGDNVKRWIGPAERARAKENDRLQTVKWPDFCAGGVFGFTLECKARTYFICANTFDSMLEWKKLIALTAMLCWRCGRQCFPSDYQGNDPNCQYLPGVGRLYHPECLRCEKCSVAPRDQRPAKPGDVFEAAYLVDDELCCNAHVEHPVAGLDILAQISVGKTEGREMTKSALQEIAADFARAAQSTPRPARDAAAIAEDGDGDGSVSAASETSSEAGSEASAEKEKGSVKGDKGGKPPSATSGKRKERARQFEALLVCLFQGISACTKEEDIDSSVMSPELNNLLYQDGRGKSILEQVTSQQISLEEATKMAKSEALSRSAELERTNPDTRPTPRNYEREVAGQRTPFEFVSLAPSTFGKIRAASGISPAEYGLSFATPPSGNLAGGASGSFVKKSHDSRLIIKSIDKTETEVLLRVLQDYLAHLEASPYSLLVRFLGLYEVRIDNRTMSVVVMENILDKAGDLRIDELYDLKGSSVSRRTKGGKNTFNASTAADAANKLVTQKDMDLERPLAVGARAKMILNMEITQDLLFLNEQGLMDYSLLVGIHNCPGEACPQCKGRRSTEVSPDGKVRSKDIHRNGVRGAGPPQHPTIKESVFVFGIIDLLQVWNNKKRVESAAKTKLLGRDEHGISAVKPDEYSVRFHEFLTQRLEE